MMKKRFFISCLFLFGLFHVYGQTVSATSEILQGYKDIPQEEIFVHQNTQLLLAGEYLYYKVYCKNRVTDALSTLSKVAYVELVSSSGNALFRHKVRLDSGTGQGDFFVPVGTPSGSYKLIAYTQWMRNGGMDLLFENGVALINPYQNTQETILVSSENTGAKVTPYETSEETVSNSRLKTDQSHYGKREKVSLYFEASDADMSQGNCSLSVRKLDVSVPFPTTTSSNYKRKSASKEPALGDPLFIPELRGEVVWGKVTSKSNNAAKARVKVALSIPGQDFVTKIANTNSEGVFYFLLQEEFNDGEATFQVLGDTEGAYEIAVMEPSPLDYEGMEFERFLIDSDLQETIVQRSVYNQIENGYYELKPDTIRVPLASPPFYGNRGKAYNLDDYKRFPTVKETFLEFIDDAWTKNENGKTVFSVRAYENTLTSNFPPLIIVDGIILQDQQKLLDYPARKIKTVSIVRDKYYLGADVFQGVIIVETLAGDFYESLTESYVDKVNLFTAQPKKSYFSQEYRSEENKRIPDFRSQLLWEPNAQLEGQKGQWAFYTSDNTGVYEISLEGFTQSGKPVSWAQRITVK